MKLVTLKDKKPTLDDVKFELNYKDKTLVSIKISDYTGAFVIIEKESSYSEGLKILEQAPPEMETVYTVAHELAGQRYFKEFTDENKAEQFFDSIRYISGITASMDKSERPKIDDDQPAPCCGDDFPF